MHVDQIEPSESNPRRDFDDDALEQLADSIDEHGVLEPLLVRPHPEADGYELVCGERRLRAAKLAGCDQVPVELREGLTDEEVLELQLAENNQREDVHPLEEADAMARLVDDYGRLGTEVADKLGRPPSYVYRRLKLTDLIDEFRQLLEEERIGIGGAELLGGLPEPFQRELLDSEEVHPDVTTWSNDEPKSWTKSDLERAVHIHSRKVADASWDLEAEYDEIRPCQGCPYRSGEQTSLVEGVSDDDRCLDQSCWQDKLDAYMEHRKDELRTNDSVELLEGEEAEKVTDNWIGQDEYFLEDDSFWHDGSFIKLDGKVPDATRYVAVEISEYQGSVREKVVLRREEILEELQEERHEDVVEAIESSTGSDDGNDRAEKRRRRRRLMGEVVDELEDVDVDEALPLLARAAIEGANANPLSAVRKRRGLEKADVDGGRKAQDLHAVRELVDDAGVDELLGLLAELLLTPLATGYSDNLWDQVVVSFGLDTGDDE